MHREVRLASDIANLRHIDAGVTGGVAAHGNAPKKARHEHRGHL